MPPVEFEPTISVGERLQTYVLDRAATGTDNQHIYLIKQNLRQILISYMFRRRAAILRDYFRSKETTVDLVGMIKTHKFHKTSNWTA